MKYILYIHRLNRSLLLNVLLIFLYGNISGQIVKDTVNIVHISDAHIVYQLEKTHPIFIKLREHLLGGADSLTKFINFVPKTLNPDAIVITGDLIDYYKAESSGEQDEMIDNQIEQFKNVYEASRVPILLTLGNHDISTYYVDEKNSIKIENQISADQARASWIRNISCFKNGTYYQKEYRVGKTNYHLFFLDNGYSLANGMFDETQLNWFRVQLEKIADEPVILFFHRYYPIGDVNGDGITIKKNKPTDWPKEDDCSKGMLKILNEHKNIKAMFVGHRHKNAWEGINFPSGHKIYEIMTSALFKGTDNWRLISFTENEITISNTGSTDKEIQIRLRN